MIDEAVSYANSNRDKIIGDLMSLIKMPSVSLDPESRGGVLSAAKWIQERLHRLEFRPINLDFICDNPIVSGSLSESKDDYTILAYGHYDVMPADPLGSWKTDPFDPTIVDEYIFGRGSSDMKAQLVGFFSAVESILQTSEMPVNLKVILEGAEEAGSPGLDEFIRKNQNQFESNCCLILDGSIHSRNLPAITYATRGLAYFDLTIQGPPSDLHSGRFGGPVENPAVVLAEAIAGMRDKNGKILLPGFYDNVRSTASEEVTQLRRLPCTDEWWRDQAGVGRLRSEVDYSATELATIRPTINVDGFHSGYSGVGEKTIIPSEAHAKISMRLVPDQTPEMVHKGLQKYLESMIPTTVTWHLEELPGCLPCASSLDCEGLQAACRALEKTWGIKPILLREGGSLPVGSYIRQHLDTDSFIMGFGLPGDNIHGPNERQHLPTFFRGIEAYIRLLFEISNSSRSEVGR